MNIGNIVKGHVNEFFGLNKDISEERLKICHKCPLCVRRLGREVCNSRLFYNPETGEVSTELKDGFYNGCGCFLKAKTSLVDEQCPLSKW